MPVKSQILQLEGVRRSDHLLPRPFQGGVFILYVGYHTEGWCLGIDMSKPIKSGTNKDSETTSASSREIDFLQLPPKYKLSRNWERHRDTNETLQSEKKQKTKSNNIGEGS